MLVWVTSLIFLGTFHNWCKLHGLVDLECAPSCIAPAFTAMDIALGCCKHCTHHDGAHHGSCIFQWVGTGTLFLRWVHSTPLDSMAARATLARSETACHCSCCTAPCGPLPRLRARWRPYPNLGRAGSNKDAYQKNCRAPCYLEVSCMKGFLACRVFHGICSKGIQNHVKTKETICDFNVQKGTNSCKPVETTFTGNLNQVADRTALQSHIRPRHTSHPIGLPGQLDEPCWSASHHGMPTTASEHEPVQKHCLRYGKPVDTN